MTTKRTTMWCAECMSDSHDYPDCPEDDSTPTPDLAAQIREDLDYRRMKLVDPDDAIAEVNFDGMRAALLAVLDATAPDSLPPNGCDCGGCLREWIRQQVVDKLGIEAENA